MNLLLFTLATLVQAPVPAGDMVEGAQSPQCVGTLATELDLEVAGFGAAYIEPDALVESDGTVLLIGHPVYVPGREAPSDTLLGAVFTDPSAGAEPVLDPLGAATAVMARAVADPGGGWAVLLGVLEPGGGFTDDLVGLWEGRLDGGSGWSEVREIPEPDPSRIGWLGTSDLVRTGTGGLAFVAAARFTGGDGDAWLYEREGQGWSRTSLGFDPSYADLEYVEGKRFLAMTGLGRAAGPSRYTVGLYVRTGDHGPTRLLVPQGPHNVHHPGITRVGERPSITWWSYEGERTGAWVILDGTDALPTPVRVDDPVAQVAPISLGDRLAWITDHRRPQNPPGTLRVWVEAGGRAHLAAEIPNPFTGPFAALARPGPSILVAGPVLYRNRSPPQLSTRILVFDLDCAP